MKKRFFLPVLAVVSVFLASCASEDATKMNKMGAGAYATPNIPTFNINLGESAMDVSFTSDIKSLAKEIAQAGIVQFTNVINNRGDNIAYIPSSAPLFGINFISEASNIFFLYRGNLSSAFKLEGILFEKNSENKFHYYPLQGSSVTTEDFTVPAAFELIEETTLYHDADINSMFEFSELPLSATLDRDGILQAPEQLERALANYETGGNFPKQAAKHIMELMSTVILNIVDYSMTAEFNALLDVNNYRTIAYKDVLDAFSTWKADSVSFHLGDTSPAVSHINVVDSKKF